MLISNFIFSTSSERRLNNFKVNLIVNKNTNPKSSITHLNSAFIKYNLSSSTTNIAGEPSTSADKSVLSVTSVYSKNNLNSCARSDYKWVLLVLPCSSSHYQLTQSYWSTRSETRNDVVSSLTISVNNFEQFCNAVKVVLKTCSL